MTRMVLTLTLACLASMASIGQLSADVLLIEEVRQAERMTLPSNGMSMSEVRTRFGEPSQQAGAVGEPPITRWEYQQWSVYFEYKLVLFTVLHKGAVIEKDKAPAP
jgi:hypothetical protein